MSYPHSMVVVCPVANRDNLEALGQAVGVDGVLSVPLSATGSEPATHYSGHGWVSPEFAALMTGQAYPDPMPDGITTEQIDAILGACVVSIDPVVDEQVLTKREHFDHVIAGAGLSVVEPEMV